MIDLDARWDENKRQSEGELLAALVRDAQLDAQTRTAIIDRASALVTKIREETQPGLMEVFLAEYGLSTDEGIALMCLAEALLRVPDPVTIDALIEDKIAPSDWSVHLGKSSSPLVNASTWGLLITGRVLEDADPGVAGTLRSMVRRLGEPVIRTAVGAAIKQMGRQFVLGETIGDAMNRAKGMESKGFTYSYDMLGEAAITADDAQRYKQAYSAAISAIANACTAEDIAANPGISVKLSALHPRYEVAKTERVMSELVPVLRDLARQASAAGMGLNIDAEEADRLGLSIKVIEAVLAERRLAGWDGLGVVVQAYGRRAGEVIDGLYELAEKHNRRLMVRLVKGAYWDTEIKNAQVRGLEDFPVFTRKAATDVSYISLARKLLTMTDRIYPQFATHNAHSVCAILDMAQNLATDKFEFQRLHGMGEALHTLTMDTEKTRCRIYAPVGAHRDLLAYLVRRLLENGANSSFVNQLIDEEVPADVVASCPFELLATDLSANTQTIATGPLLFSPARKNSKGFDLDDVTDLTRINDARERPHDLTIQSTIAGELNGTAQEMIVNPANNERIGTVTWASQEDVDTALGAASPWAIDGPKRAEILNRAADLYESHFGEAFALLAVEAGKNLADAVGELREAVDFLRYYAEQIPTFRNQPRGVFTCISPWNFPLAIFTGQVAAALAAGNAVLAKPAETTPAIAAWAVKHLHAAGVPREALQLVLGTGQTVGAQLTSNARINGIAFTGSTATARSIQKAMASTCAPGTPLIAETGGINAMIVDSTALLEQATRDIIVSAFQSAGQRCSALRCLYVQEEIAQPLIALIKGAMDELEVGDPWEITTDVGPLITADAADHISEYIAQAQQEGRLLHKLAHPSHGSFVSPALIEIAGIETLEREVFGPVLHVATFKADQIDEVVAAVNASGYGLTFGIHTRIDDRVQAIADQVKAGNIYANRNQIGAIVGSQPFGGEGLSGTGPKAGGPHYLSRFTRSSADKSEQTWATEISVSELTALLSDCPKQTLRVETTHFPGPTGELNRMVTRPRAPLICAGPGTLLVEQQLRAVRALGGQAVAVDGHLAPETLSKVPAFGGLVWWGAEETGQAYAEALASIDGPIIPLITDAPDAAHACFERHLCVDTTASGGNASLLAGGR
ncbi:MAG: bifunctional proline dehydrogenase/L-glutamate gamma-semialdehyde dehydrogenase PutA [Pseudomonadota bacterium]